MGLSISDEAAAFLLRQIAREPDKMKQPLRLSTSKGKRCGDVGHAFTFEARRKEGDIHVESGGLTILCNIDDCPEFEYAAISIARNGVGVFASERVIVIPDGAKVCGCGESATMPPAK